MIETGFNRPKRNHRTQFTPEVATNTLVAQAHSRATQIRAVAAIIAAGRRNGATDSDIRHVAAMLLGPLGPTRKNGKQQ